jgi:cytochrome bd-type quinol oxidase subunit 2
VQARQALRGRIGELAVYAAMMLGLLILIAAACYSTFPRRAASFAEPRYLMPLLPLLGAIMALAARGAGRRWGPAVGCLLVILFLGHDLFSQMLVVGRYYG